MKTTLSFLRVWRSKNQEFLALVQNFFACNDLETTNPEMDEVAFIEVFMYRFISVWGGAIWGGSEFSDVEPATVWTYECQRVTERM
jgi:hypothetical protein